MDFKERLNSCGRFSTDETFKKIIMKNSCRLRQNSAFNQKEISLNTESNNELNNIKVFQKQPLLKSETKRKEKIKEIIYTKDKNKKPQKYHRHKSDLTDNTKDNKNKSNIPNILFYYQDIRALKIGKNNVLKQINNKENTINNNSDENKTDKKKSLKKEIFSKNEKNENNENNDENKIFKSNTIFNNSDRKRLFLMKRMKNDLIKNKINTNDLKRKKFLYKTI